MVNYGKLGYIEERNQVNLGKITTIGVTPVGITAVGIKAVGVTAVKNDLKLYTIITSDLASFSDYPCYIVTYVTIM